MTEAEMDRAAEERMFNRAGEACIEVMAEHLGEDDPVPILMGRRLTVVGRVLAFLILLITRNSQHQMADAEEQCDLFIAGVKIICRSEALRELDAKMMEQNSNGG